MNTNYHDLYTGLIRLHILMHATQEPVFGVGLMDELGRHGYRLSAGTLYPLLHGLEKKGYLRSVRQRHGKRYRRVYRATPLALKALLAGRGKIHELLEEYEEIMHHSQAGRNANNKS